MTIRLSNGASVVIRSEKDAAQINVAPIMYYHASTAARCGAPICASTVAELCAQLGGAEATELKSIIRGGTPADLESTLRACITEDGDACFSNVYERPKLMQERIWQISDLARAALTRVLPYSAAEDIFQAVFEAMQNAEEMGGPEGQEYVQLMRRIETEARTRAETVLNLIREKA